MRTAGRPSWEITVDEPQVLAIALYVRDVAGLTQTAAPPGLPKVAPPVTATGDVPALPEADAQWNAWWARALTAGPSSLTELRPPHFSDFADTPALQELLRLHFDGARRWSSEVKGDRGRELRGGLPLGELVADVERRTRRATRPFRLRLDAVPVDGRDMWTVGHAHVLLSSALLDAPELLVAQLRPTVASLA